MEFDNGSASSKNAAYMFYNVETGQAYVGSTNSVKTRFNRHVRTLQDGTHYNRRFQAAYNKNPNFEFIPLLFPTVEDARNSEQRLLEENWGNPHLLNLSKSVESFRLGMKDSEETRLKKSLSKKGIPQSPELIQKRADANRGQKRSPEICKMIGDLKRGNQYWLGKNHTEESKALISQAHSRPISAGGLVFPSISAAADHYGISVASAQKRVVSPFPQWSDWVYLPK
jgi:group I intron endonuclease